MGEVRRVNDVALNAFEADRESVLTAQFESLTDVSLSEATADGATVQCEHGRTYAVSETTLTDPTEKAVGSLIVLYDITKERRRKQQLAVLNRVLRHNLRNEMTVIDGHARMIVDDGPEPYSSYASTIVASSDELLSIGEKARQFEELQDRAVIATSVNLHELLIAVRENIEEEYPDASVVIEDDTDRETISTDGEHLWIALWNLVENGIVHDPGSPSVAVEVELSGAAVEFTVRDSAPKIPNHELTPLRESEESDLQHGSGIGLWIVQWVADRLGGELSFAYESGNVVRLRLPAER